MPDFHATSTRGNVLIRGQIDMAVAPELRSALDAALHEDRCKLEVDLSAVTFMDSSGINELLRVHSNGHPVVVRGATDVVRRTLEMLGLAEVFTLDP